MGFLRFGRWRHDLCVEAGAFIRVSGRRPDQGVSKDRSAAICLTDKLLAVICVVWDHPRGAGKQRPRLHKEPSEGDDLMTRTGKASEATPRRPRKRVVNFAKRRTLRFSDDEERAVDDVRRALAKSSGRDLEEVSFSEALRLLITDREGAAEVEARALAIERQGPNVTDWGLADISDRLGYELGPIRNHIAHIGGNLNQIAKRLNIGDPVTAGEVSEALLTVAELRDVPDDIEKRIARLVDHGLPPRGTV
ncbi:plasmid mobilization relaxosome protein MobC [Microbacterium sp. UMB0228]|nr:plasmid mobilization relaxosome protein MobC [Microbacterium sp. str. 'China']PMC06402.1 plasmid mobilization relaxosome protein MobC [Microbacterium sp. UMB0228]